MAHSPVKFHECSPGLEGQADGTGANDLDAQTRGAETAYPPAQLRTRRTACRCMEDRGEDPELPGDRHFWQIGRGVAARPTHLAAEVGVPRGRPDPHGPRDHRLFCPIGRRPGLCLLEPRRAPSSLHVGFSRAPHRPFRARRTVHWGVQRRRNPAYRRLETRQEDRANSGKFLRRRHDEGAVSRVGWGGNSAIVRTSGYSKPAHDRERGDHPDLSPTGGFSLTVDGRSGSPSAGLAPRESAPPKTRDMDSSQAFIVGTP
jgi:hypothetical protein